MYVRVVRYGGWEKHMQYYSRVYVASGGSGIVLLFHNSRSYAIASCVAQREKGSIEYHVVDGIRLDCCTSFNSCIFLENMQRITVR